MRYPRRSGESIASPTSTHCCSPLSFYVYHVTTKGIIIIIATTKAGEGKTNFLTEKMITLWDGYSWCMCVSLSFSQNHN